MLRVLIADDEIDARDNMIALIDWKSRGMKVIAAVDDGLSAYETIAAQQPDIVLIDIQMRGMSGLDVIENVRKLDCLQPVFIIISGYDYFAYMQKAIQLKVDGYLLKPFRPKDVLEILDAHFGDADVSRRLQLRQSALGDFLMELSRECEDMTHYPVREEGMVINAMLSGSESDISASLNGYMAALRQQSLSTAGTLKCCIILYAEMCRHLSRRGVNAGMDSLNWDAGDPIGSMRDLLSAVALSVHGELAENASIKSTSPAIRAKAYIDENFPEPLSLEMVADAVSVTPTYLSNCFARDVGTGFVDYIKSVRTAHAKRMLAHSTQSVSQIAEACGYPNVKYFKQVFKQQTGLSPFEFRRQMQSDAGFGD